MKAGFRTLWLIFNPWAMRGCPHSNLVAVYGDEINYMTPGCRVWCRDCLRDIKAGTHLADLRKIEGDV